MPTVHDYPVSLTWSGGRGGTGTLTADGGLVRCDLAVPEEFQGPGGGANPEMLLSSAIASCYAITFGIICENRKLPVQSVDVEATGHVEGVTPLPIYNAITIRATIKTTGATEEQKQLILDMAHKADSYCIVTNTLRDKVKIEVQPTIVEV